MSFAEAGISADLDRGPIFRDRAFLTFLERPLVFSALELLATDQVRKNVCWRIYPKKPSEPLIATN